MIDFPDGIRVGFTGTHHGMSWPQYTTWWNLVLPWKPITFEHGDCVGADSQSHYAVFYCLPDTKIRVHPPEKPEHKANCLLRPGDEVLSPASHLKRNRNIVEATTIMTATPPSMVELERGGTWYTIRYARKLNRPLVIVFPDGSVVKERF